MRERWLPVGVLAGLLFAINVIARLVTRFGFDGETEAADRVSFGMFVLIGAVLAGVALVWGRRRPVAAWGGDVAVAVLVAMALTILVGPFVSGSHPFADGAAEFFAQVGFYAVTATVGALLGHLVLTALGRDHRSQALKRYAERRQARPRRVVRR